MWRTRTVIQRRRKTMLTFNGYIPLRRGVLEHVHTGRLSLMEYLVFNFLLVWADRRTGIAETNGPGIVYLSGGQIKLRAVQDCLASLEEKGYIKRPFYVQGQRGDQKIFIDKYIVTDGVLSGSQLILPKTTDWQNPFYESRGEQGGANSGEHSGVLGGADRGSNNNGELRIENRADDDYHQPASNQSGQTNPKANPVDGRGHASPRDPALTGDHRRETLRTTPAELPADFPILFKDLEHNLGVTGKPIDLIRLASYPYTFLWDAASWASDHPYWKQLRDKHISHFVRACLKERGLLDQFEEARNRGKAKAAAVQESTGDPAPARERGDHKFPCFHGNDCARLPDCDCWCHKEEAGEETEVELDAMSSAFEIVDD